MSPREVLAEAAGELAAAGVASPEYDAAELLAHVLGTSRGQLILVDDVPAAARADFEALIARRTAREPLQHLIGTAHFRYVELVVGPGVFVPRPETELLAGWAIEMCRSMLEERSGVPPAGEERGGVPPSVEERRSRVSKPPARGFETTSLVPREVSSTSGETASTDGVVVVDLCTGSGAIAKAIKHEVPTADVHAVELDAAALGYAERNLAGTGVDLRHGDMATAFDDLDGTVDVVVCNPPYVPLEAWESVAVEARDHDPHLALFSGQDGLDAIRLLADRAARLLRPGGVIGVEHADVQGESAPAVFSGSDRWREVRDHRDLAGRPRFLTARLAR